MTQEYEMTEQELDSLLAASQPVICMQTGSYKLRSTQQNANSAWAELGQRMGFDSGTVKLVAGKSALFFTANPVTAGETAL